MKKRIKEIQDEFEALFKQKIAECNMRYYGCEAIETNDNDEPLNKSKAPKGYTKEYMKVMKDFVQELIFYKS